MWYEKNKYFVIKNSYKIKILKTDNFQISCITHKLLKLLVYSPDNLIIYINQYNNCQSCIDVCAYNIGSLYYIIGDYNKMFSSYALSAQNYNNFAIKLLIKENRCDLLMLGDISYKNYYEGKYYQLNKKYQNAIIIFEKLLTNYIFGERATKNIGKCYQCIGNTSSALHYYSKLSNDYQYYYLSLYYKLYDDISIYHYSNILQNDKILWFLGKYYYKVCKYDKAIHNLTRLDNNKKALNLLGYIYWKIENNNELAEKYFLMSAEFNYKYAYINLGDYYSSTGFRQIADKYYAMFNTFSTDKYDHIVQDDHNLILNFNLCKLN